MDTMITVRDATDSTCSVRRIAVEELVAQVATLEAELSAGRAVDLVLGDRVIGIVHAKTVTEPGTRPVKRHIPDFMARMRSIWGDEVLPGGTTTQWIRDDRDGV